MPAQGLPEIYRLVDEYPITWADAMNAWETPATSLLTETAQAYHGTATAPHLAAHVQEQSEIYTTVPVDQWLPRLLSRVAKSALLNKQPPLMALCVDENGSVYDNYASWIELPGQEAPPASPDLHAARDRLACYREFAIDLPEDGGEPGPMPRVVVTTRTRRSSSGQTGSAARTAPRRPASRTPKPPRRLTAEKARRLAADEPAKVCASCFMQLPGSGVCDKCG